MGDCERRRARREYGLTYAPFGCTSVCMPPVMMAAGESEASRPCDESDIGPGDDERLRDGRRRAA